MRVSKSVLYSIFPYLNDIAQSWGISLHTLLRRVRSHSDILHSHEYAYYFLFYRKTLLRFSVTRSFL